MTTHTATRSYSIKEAAALTGLPADASLGALAGVVVDDAVRPLAGANVSGPEQVASLAEDAIVLGRELGSLRTPALARFALARAEGLTAHARAIERRLD